MTNTEATVSMVDHLGWECPCGHLEELDDDNCTDCGGDRGDDLNEDGDDW